MMYPRTQRVTLARLQSQTGTTRGHVALLAARPPTFVHAQLSSSCCPHPATAVQALDTTSDPLPVTCNDRALSESMPALVPSNEVEAGGRGSDPRRHGG
ncbi:unnamed protein product [Lampetra planeri]